jgi:hypothetical protein
LCPVGVFSARGEKQARNDLQRRQHSLERQIRPTRIPREYIANIAREICYNHPVNTHPEICTPSELSIVSDRRPVRMAAVYLPHALPREVRKPASVTLADIRQATAGRTDMTIRTSQATMTFKQRFQLDGFPGSQPAGEYRVDMDEELIEGLSFIAYRRVAALLHLPALSAPQDSIQIVTMPPSALDAMLERDASA